MFKLIAVIALLAGAALFGRAAMMPGDYRIEHAIDIAAPPKAIMPYLDNFRAWPSWAPRERQDLGMAMTYSGAASGVGAIYAWSTAGDGGSGQMTIVNATPTRLRIEIDARSPIARAGSLEFKLEAADDLTHVTASFSGHNSLWLRLRYPVSVPDETISARFDEALTNLKLVVEAN